MGDGETKPLLRKCVEIFGHFALGVPVSYFARDLDAANQDGSRLVGPAPFGQGLSFLKVGRDVLGVRVDHRLKLGQAALDVPFADPRLGERVLQKDVVWIGLEQLFQLSGGWQVFRPGQSLLGGTAGGRLSRFVRRRSKPGNTGRF
jgi:hypothetical protein